MRSRSTGSPRRKWRMARVASRAQQVLFSRARGPREWWDIEWMSGGQCEAVWGWCWAAN